MPFDKVRLERLALEAEKLSQESNSFVDPVLISTLANNLSLPLGEVQHLALYLRDLGWIRMPHDTQNSFIITPFGYGEIAKLRRPAWRKWVDTHPKAAGMLLVALGSVGTVISNLILEFLKRYFWPEG